MIPLRFQAVFLLAALSILAVAVSDARAKLSPLAPEPDWSMMELFQETITKEEFLAALDEQFAPGGSWRSTIAVEEDRAVIKTALDPVKTVELRFGDGSRTPPRFWRSAAELGPAPPDKPLQGLRITLDPGHLGGPWARMEERWFKIGDARPVTEGDMTLIVARHLEFRLAALGAEVSHTRSTTKPSTNKRPDDLFDAARASLRARGQTFNAERYKGFDDPARPGSLQIEAERLFYRTAEIRARAERVNKKLKPDLVLAIHFNAEPWGDPANPTLVDNSHLHLLVTGAFARDELAHDDIRREMLVKLLNRAGREEASIAKPVAAALAAATSLPPYIYKTPNAKRLSTFVWARNLLASRLFECPVIYLEPYVMNDRADHRRIQLGDYDGVRPVNGTPRKSIFREYADAVAEGLAVHYRAARPAAHPR